MAKHFESLIIDRKLPERSNLVFYFNKPDNPSDYFKVTLPFFENVSVKESKRARYNKYSLIGRSSNLYSYGGADSRLLSLTFNITLPHILSIIKDTSFQKYQNYSQSEDLEKQKELFKKQTIDNTQSRVTNLIGNNYIKTTEDEYTRLAKDPSYTQGNTYNEILIYPEYSEPRKTALDIEFDRVFGSSAAKARYAMGAREEEGQLPYRSIEKRQKTRSIPFSERATTTDFKFKVIDLIMYWLNIIRSSNVNHAKNPTIGPPIVRLSHGIMYQDVPCICTDFTISNEEIAGYDVDTLLPRIIKVEMKLEEVRTGDFGTGSNNYYITKDNLKGWESVLSDKTQSMDPGYNYAIDELEKPPVEEITVPNFIPSQVQRDPLGSGYLYTDRYDL
jgi:hypothetical protein